MAEASSTPSSVVGASLEDVFRDDGFLNANGLSVDNVVAYFSLSPFYTARQRLPGARQFVGVKTVSPELLLIEERQATSQAADADHSTVCVWYCLNGSILQCPSLHAVIASRLRKVAAAVKACTEHLEGERGHTPFGGFFWEHVEREAQVQEEDAAKRGGSLQDSVRGRQRDSQLLHSQAEQVDAVVRHVEQALGQPLDQAEDSEQDGGEEGCEDADVALAP